MPPFDNGEKDYEPITIDDLREEKMMVAKPIYDILTAAREDDLLFEKKGSFVDKLRKDYHYTGIFVNDVQNENIRGTKVG